MCGSEAVFGRDVGYMDATICQCPHCHHQWIQMGRRRHLREEQSLAMREWWSTVWIYCLHGVFVWPIFSLVHFLIVVPHPIKIVVEFGPRVGGIVLGLAAAGGVCLGYGLQSALNWTSRLWPAVRAMHVLVPLLVAAVAGGLYGGILSQLGESDPGLREVGFTARAQWFSMTLGAAFGMLATPIIIVRGSKVLARKGLRRPLPKPRDPRWEC
jgi:hypothetical protein